MVHRPVAIFWPVRECLNYRHKYSNWPSTLSGPFPYKGTIFWPAPIEKLPILALEGHLAEMASSFLPFILKSTLPTKIFTPILAYHFQPLEEAFYRSHPSCPTLKALFTTNKNSMLNFGWHPLMTMLVLDCSYVLKLVFAWKLPGFVTPKLELNSGSYILKLQKKMYSTDSEEAIKQN